MIKQTKTGWKFKGTIQELFTEATTMIRGLYETLQKQGDTEEEAKEQIQRVFDLALKTNDELLDEATKKLIGLLKGTITVGNPEYKVWCETDEIKNKVLVAMESRGLVFPDGDKPTEEHLTYKAPMGFVVEGNLFMVRGEQKEQFDELECEQLNSEDLIKEVEGNE